MERALDRSVGADLSQVDTVPPQTDETFVDPDVPIVVSAPATPPGGAVRGLLVGGGAMVLFGGLTVAVLATAAVAFVLGRGTVAGPSSPPVPVVAPDPMVPPEPMEPAEAPPRAPESAREPVEATPVVAPKPAAAKPLSRPRPRPAPVAKPVLGTVEVHGDARLVVLVGSDGPVEVGDVAAGSYDVWASFGPEPPTLASTTPAHVAEGEVVTVECSSATVTCAVVVQ